MPTTATFLFPYPLATDTPDVPRDVKALADRLEVYELVPTFTGAEAAWRGANPPANTRKIRNEGTATFAVAAGGGFNISLPGFANGIVSIVVVPGDNFSGLAYIIPVILGSSITTFNGAAYTSTGAAVAAGASIRVNWFAVGW